MAGRPSKFWQMCVDVRSKSLKEVRTALEEGADPNSRGGCYNRTCLMMAVANYSEDLFLDCVVDLLLAQPGIEVNAKDSNGLTALHIAGAYGNLATLKKILAVPGLLLNEKDHKGRTPIMLVASLGQTDAVKMMVAKKGIDLWVKDNEDKDLEEACPEFRRNEIVKLLKEAKQKPIIEKVQIAMPHTLPFLHILVYLRRFVQTLPEA